MSFIFKCPHCNQKLEAEDEWIGQQVDCPACGRTIKIQKSEKHDGSGWSPEVPPWLHPEELLKGNNSWRRISTQNISGILREALLELLKKGNNIWRRISSSRFWDSCANFINLGIFHNESAKRYKKGIGIILIILLFVIIGWGWRAHKNNKPPFAVRFTEIGTPQVSVEIENLDKSNKHKISFYVDGKKESVIDGTTFEPGKTYSYFLYSKDYLPKKGAKFELYAEGFSSPIKGVSPGLPPGK